MERVEELGMRVIQLAARSPAAARMCLEFVVSRQTSDELAAGMSIYKNGVGLDKHDAQRIASLKGMPGRPSEIENMVCKYSRQIAEAIIGGELDMGELEAATDDEAKNAVGTESGVSSDRDYEEEGAEEEGGRGGTQPTPRDVVTRHGIVRGADLTLPSHSMVETLLRISRDLAGRAEGDAPPWTPEEVADEFNSREACYGTSIDIGNIDRALYLAIGEGATEEGQWVRVYWPDESRWVTAKVTGIDRNMGFNRTIHLVFWGDDESEGDISGDDANMMYRLAPGAIARKKRRLVIDDDE